MTPSDDLEINGVNLPPSVSSASSLDSLQIAGRGQSFVAAGSLGEHDTRQNASVASFSSRGDEAAEAPNAPQSQNNQGTISPAVSAAIPSAAPLSFSSLMLPSNHLGVPVLPSGTPLTMPGTAGNNSIPEFLYQLTKMLTDNNRHIIEWTNGKIEVHSPHRLEAEVLHKYFRHSKFASFQRQLNYFGFRKNAGKGKMAPCSYVNEATTNDLSSVLLIKRKTSASLAASAKDKEKKKEPATTGKVPQRKVSSEDNSIVNPVLAGIIQQPNPATTAASAPRANAPTGKSSLEDSFKAVAKSAVGRGIRHNFTSQSLPPIASAAAARPDETQSETTTVQNVQRDLSQDSLSQLATNYRNSLIDYHGDDTNAEEFHFDADPTPLSQMQGDASTSSGFFSRDPSLLELAMIPEAEEGDGHESAAGFSFVDFPHPEVRPKSSGWDENA